MNTKVKYLGMDLCSPIVVASCGLTGSVDNLHKLEQAGAGAVVLKSVFEEEIIHDIKRNTHVFAPVNNYGASYEYVAQHLSDDAMARHFELIKEAKSSLSIPIIGSINCYSHENWITYATQFQEAGCDALELDMAIMPYDTNLSSDDVERTFGDIIQSLRKFVTIPISIKVSPYFTDLSKFMQQLSWMGIQGITIFNKSVQIDVDLENETLRHAEDFSTPGDFYNTLRWTTILTNKVRCDISSTTGVYTANDVVKLLLAGATTVQVASCLYNKGIDHLKELNHGVEQWMQQKGYTEIDQFRGKLALKSNEKASMLMRTKYMNYFGEIK
ncbi:MAG: dihydroorotate dehydrogenase-like protein [Bacteroidales bacterium]|nr:dihydroorotate dehydrogenase-like protein [Bacteroidales bacterium]